MEESLVYLYEATLAVGGVYLGIGFVVEMADFWKRCTPEAVAARADSAAVKVNAIALPPATAPVMTEKTEQTTAVEVGTEVGTLQG